MSAELISAIVFASLFGVASVLGAHQHSKYKKDKRTLMTHINDNEILTLKEEIGQLKEEKKREEDIRKQKEADEENKRKQKEEDEKREHEKLEQSQKKTEEETYFLKQELGKFQRINRKLQKTNNRLEEELRSVLVQNGIQNLANEFEQDTQFLNTIHPRKGGSNKYRGKTTLKKSLKKARK